MYRYSQFKENIHLLSEIFIRMSNIYLANGFFHTP